MNVLQNDGFVAAFFRDQVFVAIHGGSISGAVSQPEPDFTPEIIRNPLVDQILQLFWPLGPPLLKNFSP